MSAANKVEQRIFSPALAKVRLETREDGKPPRIIGVAAVYYNGRSETQYELWEDGPVERIMPGAFSATLRDSRQDVRGLFNHDPNQVLGRRSSGSLRLSDSPEGLQYEIDPPDTSAGRDVAELIRRGDISGSSFGFVVTDQEYRMDDGREIREIRGATVIDVSPVTFPAYTGTDVQVRSADPAREYCEQARAVREAHAKREAYLGRLERQQELEARDEYRPTD